MINPILTETFPNQATAAHSRLAGGAARYDLDAIAAVVMPRARVLDLGCGNGELLARLVQEKQVIARGVELNEADVRACIGRGLSVRQGNIEEGLEDYADGAFDYVLLSDTIGYLNVPAPVLREMLRVGAHAVISFENAGHWRNRLRALRGDGFGAPLSSGAPRERAITLPDFEAFVAAAGARVKAAAHLSGRTRQPVALWPALRGSMVVYTVVKA
jgi:methionine biosynthesis protein MetW